jgi:hypothetical protein
MNATLRYVVSHRLPFSMIMIPAVLAALLLVALLAPHVDIAPAAQPVGAIETAPADKVAAKDPKKDSSSEFWAGVIEALATP